MYKKAVSKGDTHKLHVEVEEGWRLLLWKGGDPMRYKDALLKYEFAYLVEDAIAEFSMRCGVCRNALLSHVQFFFVREIE